MFSHINTIQTIPYYFGLHYCKFSFFHSWHVCHNSNTLETIQNGNSTRAFSSDICVRSKCISSLCKQNPSRSIPFLYNKGTSASWLLCTIPGYKTHGRCGHRRACKYSQWCPLPPQAPTGGYHTPHKLQVPVSVLASHGVCSTVCMVVRAIYKNKVKIIMVSILSITCGCLCGAHSLWEDTYVISPPSHPGTESGKTPPP